MESNSSPLSSAPLPKSRVRVLPILRFASLLSFLFLFLFLNFAATASASVPQIPNFDALYSKHCNSIVAKSDPDPSRWVSTNLSVADIGFRNGYFSGGERIFGNQDGLSYLKALSFSPIEVRKTVTEGIFDVRSVLQLRNFYRVGDGNSTQRNPRLFYHRVPGQAFRKGMINFLLSGYYSESSRKLCMVGEGMQYFNRHPFVAVLKLNYPKNSSIYESLITGVLESLYDKYDPNDFKRLNMLALYQRTSYEYKLAGKDSESGCLQGDGDDHGENLSLRNQMRGLCRLIGNLRTTFELEYGSDCGSVNCDPVGGNAGNASYLVYHVTRCTDERNMQMLLGFSNTRGHLEFPFDPKTTFIAEGAWSEKENRLCAVVCRILNFTESLTNAFVGDCSTKLSLSFPARLSLRNRSTVVGQIWSNKEVNDSGYFGKIRFRSLSENLMELLDYKYDYSENDSVRKTCVEKKAGRVKGKKYPAGLSSDMKFGMTVKNSDGHQAYGYSSPLFVDEEQIFRRRNWDYLLQTESPMQQKKNRAHSSPMNVSYRLWFTRPEFRHDVFPSKAELSAEGIYDMDYGNLCMIGCRRVPLKNQTLIQKDMLDCAVRINVQFSPLDTKDRENVRGSIESTRGRLDPLFFETIQFSSNSIYHNQAAASISRIDLEIVMVLISNTLACVLIGLQLLHVKKHPDVLPFISIMTLIVLGLGYMIPLLVNFKAMFVPNHHIIRRYTFLGTGGWLQVNEVIVRMLMMVALLLLLHLLQLTWSARQRDGNQKSLRDSEWKVVYATLPLYIAGGLIVWFVYLSNNSHLESHRPFRRNRNPRHYHRMAYKVSSLHPIAYEYHPLRKYLSSYAGFVLDGFLLPQILFNLFFNSGEKALASTFYVGTTIIRLLPHAYDLYRARTGTWFVELPNIYASHRIDFYSTAWNIVIPCGGMLFAAVVFLQQRFSGRCILPKRYRQSSSVYEKVPVISNEQL